MTTEVTVTCDGCGKVIEPGTDHVQLAAHQVDTGQGVTSAPSYADYHPDCLPTTATEDIGYEHNSLVGTVLPGAEEPITPNE